jgi:hypothetical protein
MTLLEYALQNENYDLAARVLVYGLLKATIREIEENGKEKRRPTRQPKRSQARPL